MVEMVDPKPSDVVGDHACGTGGFLVQAMEYLLRTYTSPEGIIEERDPETGIVNAIYTGDLLEGQRDHISSDMFHGFDFDATMLRISAMNLMLHGVNDPDIHYQDTLSTNFTERFPKSASEGFNVILANPPFKGSLDFDDVDASLLRQVKTKKTELLFVALILRMLKTGGRSATIVPDGVLFNSSGAHHALRKMLIDNNQLEAVISLPSGVFKPYAGVSTGILVFTKHGRTDNVFFYDVQADGFSLDDKREPTEANDLPDCLAHWARRNDNKETNRATKTFLVPVEEIRRENYSLSITDYRDHVYDEKKYDPPREILGRMKTLSDAIALDIAAIEEMLR
jgi:type I restriction enzyme M protein